MLSSQRRLRQRSQYQSPAGILVRPRQKVWVAPSHPCESQSRSRSSDSSLPQRSQKYEMSSSSSYSSSVAPPWPRPCALSATRSMWPSCLRISRHCPLQRGQRLSPRFDHIEMHSKWNSWEHGSTLRCICGGSSTDREMVSMHMQHALSSLSTGVAASTAELRPIVEAISTSALMKHPSLQ